MDKSTIFLQEQKQAPVGGDRRRRVLKVQIICGGRCSQNESRRAACFFRAGSQPCRAENAGFASAWSLTVELCAHERAFVAVCRCRPALCAEGDDAAGQAFSFAVHFDLQANEISIFALPV